MVMAGGGHACLRCDMMVATLLMDFWQQTGAVFTLLMGTALAMCNFMITTPYVFVSLPSGNILCLFIS